MATSGQFRDRLWALFHGRRQGAAVSSAGQMISRAREIKTHAEIYALTQAALSIDRVHARVPEVLSEGRTEAAVAKDIERLIIDEGHVHADFVIVAARANAANPHHRPGPTVIERGDSVLIDIGGTTAHGYASDSTRNYAIGRPPSDDYLEKFELLRSVQREQRRAVTPGVRVSDVDGLARELLGARGAANYFTHRTGHGIGMDTHEHPYIQDDSEERVLAGMAFSIEPGVYVAGRFGIRIEDILVCGSTSAVTINRAQRDLLIV